MFWNSVVGKLWITIIGLVAVVLTLLSLLLVQFLDGFYYQQGSENLRQLALKIAEVVEAHPDKEHVQTARDILRVHQTNMIVLGLDKDIPAAEQVEGLPVVDPALIIGNEYLDDVKHGQVGFVRDRFPVYLPEAQQTEMMDVLAVSVPFEGPGEAIGMLFMYQTLEELSQTTKEATKYILYAAAIGIALATIFAFFLSTRITNPLRQMKKAADSLSRGDFSTKITIRSKDEIGNLATTFNHMAKQLDDLIHALSREKEQLSSVLRSMVDGVITVDDQARIMISNPPAEEVMKAVVFEQSGMEWSGLESFIGSALPEPFASFSQKVMEEEVETVTDITLQGRTWSIVMAPLYNRNQVRGAVAVLRDMTKERQLDKLRKDFVSNVSHELRTPLAMLQGYSEAIIDDIATDPRETKEMAQIIYEESVRMTRLVNDLLDLGRMESGFIELNKTEVALLPLIDKIMKKFDVLGKEQNIEMISELSLSPGDTFMLDPDRIEQVLTNLIDNALRHTDAQGQVIVSVALKEQGLYIEVKDTGSGIPEEDLPFVFERFYKADKARTRGQAGTGLGLSIARQITQAHGGQIAVHSKLSEGTTFSIHIPKNEMSA